MKTKKFMFARCAVALMLATASSRYAIAGSAWTMMNPTGMTYSNELVRIKVEAPEDVSRDAYAVTEDGKEVPWQVEESDGQKH